MQQQVDHSPEPFLVWHFVVQEHFADQCSSQQVQDQHHPIEVAAKLTACFRPFENAANGDMPAFETLVERYRDSLYSFALQMTRSETEALEVVQKSFLAACRQVNQFRTEAELVRWIYGTAASHAFDQVPPLQRPESLQDGAAAERLRDDCVDDSQERTLSPQLRRAIEQTMEGLPEYQREVFLLKDVAGLDYDQIAG
jgi:RNA polymerase sigma-70 factor (ECF subfamily)